MQDDIQLKCHQAGEFLHIAPRARCVCRLAGVKCEDIETKNPKHRNTEISKHRNSETKKSRYRSEKVDTIEIRKKGSSEPR